MGFFEKKKKIEIIKVKQGWYHHEKNSTLTIIFIHGFCSDSDSCWRSKQNFWPELIKNDNNFVRNSIFICNYYTNFNSGNYSISDCSSEIFSQITNRTIKGDPPAINSEKILFICHSLGGIVARHMLESKASSFENKKIGLMLMASPSLGSNYADAFGTWIKFFKNETAKQLKSSNSFLTDLDRRFKHMLAKNNRVQIVGIEAVESNSFVKTKFTPDFIEKVVTLASCSRYFHDYKTIPNTNHSSIVKPTDVEHPSHRLLHEFIDSNMCDPTYESEQVCNPVQIEGDVLFDILSTVNIQYYLVRECDNEIKKSADYFSLWVCGPSGCGKTSAVRYLTLSNQKKPIFLCLSNYTNIENCSLEILETAKNMGIIKSYSSKNSYLDLIFALEKISSYSNIVLHLDEIPLDDDGESILEFVKYLSGIIQSVQQRSSVSNVRIIISSIFSPKQAMLNVPKISEQIKIIDLYNWSDDEINSLILRIIYNKKMKDISEDNRRELIKEAQGSPRFIKTFFRNKLINSSIGFDSILTETKLQVIR